MQHLTLPRTRLTLRDGELVKTGDDDVVVARFPTDRIARLSLEKTHAFGTACAVVAVLGALALVARLHVESPAWSWAAIIVCAAGCALVLLGIEGRELVIKTRSGEARYPVMDVFEEAEGFVLSANGLLGLDAARPAAPARPDPSVPLADAPPQR